MDRFLCFFPTLATTGILRTLTPWVTADWPARTGIRSTTFATHHPKQTAIALKADLFRGNPEVEPVWVRLRRIAGENIGSWEKIPLIHQGETRFERLFEAGSDAVEFQFLTRDVETNIQRIDFVEAPTLASIKATVTPPQYATMVQSQIFELGNGTNNRGRIPVSILESSTVGLDMLPTTTIVVPQEGPQRDEWLRSTFNWSNNKKSDQPDDLDFQFSESNGMWHIDWRADRSRSIIIRLMDNHGVPNIDDIQVVLDVAADLPLKHLSPNQAQTKPFSQRPGFHSRVWVEMILDLTASLFKRNDQPLGAKTWFLLMPKGFERQKQKQSLISLRQMRNPERFSKLPLSPTTCFKLMALHEKQRAPLRVDCVY